MTLNEAIDRLYDLNPGVVGIDGERHERPHKPLLLLATLDLIDEGLASPEHIPWGQHLRNRFTARFEKVQKHNDQNDPALPFRHLGSSGFWLPLEPDGTTKLVRDPTVRADGDRVFARFIDGLEALAALPEARAAMREAILSRYFPALATGFDQSATHEAAGKVAEDETPEQDAYGRSPAFRRLILRIYDHQCAACGLRIRLAHGNDVSFIDAAHLIPFAVSGNDHPSNGLALCKNHHWAMDREVIAPGPDHHWHVSKAVDPRRSNGEQELAGLMGKSILLPKDTAFHPEPEGLAWRLRRLIA